MREQRRGQGIELLRALAPGLQLEHRQPSLKERRNTVRCDSRGLMKRTSGSETKAAAASLVSRTA
jgi:hypothetical protein